MNNHNGQNENFIEITGATEEDIYNALIELGWLLPRNEDELRRAEKALESVECPPFPTELEDPAPLIERLRREQEEKLDQTPVENEKPESHLRLVAKGQTNCETAFDSSLTATNAEELEEETAPSFPALLHREIPDKTPSVVAEELGVNRIFLKLVSDNRETIPNSWRDELAKEANNVFSIEKWRSKQTLSKHSAYQQIAASRAKPYSDRKMSWHEILQKSGLSSDREAHYRRLAEDEEKHK